MQRRKWSSIATIIAYQLQDHQKDIYAACMRGCGARLCQTRTIESLFIEPVRFLQAIADKVPPILQARSFAFIGLAEEAASRVTQQVLITDSFGQQWIVDFQLERQEFR